jgi:hypothetical protein
MAGTDFSEVGDHVVGARDHVMTGKNCVLPHLRWELEQVMLGVRPQDLSAVEVAGLLAILRPAHSRVIGGPAGRLRLVVRGVFAASPS